MEKRLVTFDTVEEIEKFVKAAEKIPGDIVLKAGRYAVDAKSLLGVISIGLKKPIRVYLNCEMTREMESGLNFKCAY